MIKLKREKKPKILIEKEKEWTEDLLKLVKQYGSYSDIPKEIRDKAIKYYRHDDIKLTLFKSSNNKCAFCESIPEDGGGFIAIEHFYPKSIYPESTFEWNNLLPICNKCNIDKLDYDTKKNEVINPYVDDPEEMLEFINIRLKEKDDLKNKIKSKNTIREYSLNRITLLNMRSQILCSLANFEERLEVKLEEVMEEEGRKKINRTKELRGILDEIEIIADVKKTNYFFIRDYLKKSEIFQRVQKYIKNLNI